MNTIKKIMFMSNDNNTNEMGILKLEQKNNIVFGTIKTYNSNIMGNYILGIKLENKIVKQNVNIENNNYNFISNEINNLDTVQGSVLIELSDGEFKPIIWGNNKDKNHKANIINSIRQSINNISNAKTKQSIESISTKPKHNNTTAVKNENNVITKNITEQNSNTQTEYLKNINEAKIQLQQIAKQQSQNKLLSNSEVYHPIQNYKHTVESLSKIAIDEEPVMSEIAVSCSQEYLFESNDEEIENSINKELNNEFQSQGKFYNMISDQLQELFDRYPQEDNLNKLIDNSYWIKIDTDIDNKHYVVGIIKDNDDIKYICYGVPGTYNQEPPVEMRQYSQWLPTNITDPYNNGYWVMYQDAETGENVYIN